MTAPATTYKTITMIGDQETTVTVMATTTAPAPSSMTTIDNTTPDPSTTVETTTTAPSPLPSTWQDRTTITEPGLSITTKMMAPSSKATNTYTNKNTMTSVGTTRETGLSLEPGGLTRDPSHSDNSSLSSGPSVSDREIERLMREIESIKNG